MEKSKSFSGYSNAYSEIRLGFEERSGSYSFNGPAGKVDDVELESSGNPELKRRKRVAQYNMYTMEGKIKSSLRNSFKWIKSKLVDDYFDDWTYIYIFCRLATVYIYFICKSVN